MESKMTEGLLNFIEKSPSCFHAVRTIGDRLKEEGFLPLSEKQRWDLKRGNSYYVTRNDSSLIAFTIPAKTPEGFRIFASHSDSPSFKIKEEPEITAEKHYLKLNVEGYGGMLCAPWFDRPLSVAGRVVVKEGEEYVSKLVNIDRDLLMIPSLAIHMNREANKGYAYNLQKDMLPLYGEASDSGSFFEEVARWAGVLREEILGHDLFLYNRMKGTVWGARQEFVSSGRLDDLQCAYAGLEGYLMAEKEKTTAVYCVFDNEEVGSATKQGAESTFLQDVLMRIVKGMQWDYEEYLIQLARSFMISADNAHAVHPNYGDCADPVHRPCLNGGIVIKFNANQKYCTDGVSAAMFKDLCKKAGVACQLFVNRSDVAGGSTLGNIANTKVAMNTVDIGLPQLAMHSPYETAGVKDTEALILAAKEFFD